MTTFLIVLHVIACVFLIAVVLLQRGKGAEMGAVFGGGASSTVFGSRGAGNFLTRLTTISAIVFMGTSLALSYSFTSEAGDRLFEDEGLIEEANEGTTTPLFEEVGIAPAVEEDAEAEAAGDSLLEGLEEPAEPGQ